MSEEQTQLESVLDCLSIAIIIIGSTDLRIHHINKYAKTQLEKLQVPLIGQTIEEVLPGKVCAIILPILQEVGTSKQERLFDAVPFEGFFDTNTRTYWRITIKPLQATWFAQVLIEDALCITCEDRTQEVRARLHLDIIRSISATIAGPHTLTHVLDRVLDAVHTFAFAITFHDVTRQTEARERIEAEVVARTSELAERNFALQQAQLAQETERARLELLIERLPSGVMLVSAYDASIITINSYAVQILRSLGVSMPPISETKQLIGANVETLLHQTTMYDSTGSVIPYQQQPLALALYRGEATESEFRTENTEEQPLYLLANAAPLRAPDDTVTSAILVLWDITTLKRLERARESFFTAMAHELKTPLANVRAHLSAFLIRDVKWSEEEQYDFIKAADEQVEQLIGMIHRILSASRVEVGALRPRLEPFFLPEFLEDLQERLAALIYASKHRLEFCVEANLPAIEADYELIMSVITNLLSNAFRYTPDKAAVTLEAHQLFDATTMRATGVRLSVHDNGPGIPAEIQKRLFKRFSTFSSVSHAERATMNEDIFQGNPSSGLGLYISKGIIEAHHSSLELLSRPGGGTSFSFTLPIAASTQSSSMACEVTQTGLSANG